MGREGRVNGEDESREGAGGVKGDFPESVGMDKGGSRVDRGGMEFPRLQHAFFTQRLELRHPWTIARGTAAFKEYQYVRLERGGRMAWGEAAHNARYGESLASVRAGLEAGWALVEAGDLAGSAERLSRLGSGLPRAAVAALEMALVDLEGKEQGRSAREVLGVPEGLPPPTSFSLGMGAREEMQAKVREAAGFAVLKLKLGSDRDRELVQAVREVTDQVLRVDANEGWTDAGAALRQIEWLAGQGVELVEQPLPAGRLAEMAWLRERSPLPLFADEDVVERGDLARLAGAYDGVNLKVMKSGGPREVWRMVQAAREAGLQVMLGCMIESSCGIAAAAALAGAVDFVDLDGHLLLAQDPFRGLRLEEGRVLPGEGPGLGVEWVGSA